MTETQERFLRAILAQVPLDTVVELHLFPPIRRGTLETGVAVVVTELPPAAPVWLEPSDEDVIGVEDPELLDPALGDADTDTRADGDVDATDDIAELADDEASEDAAVVAESGDSAETDDVEDGDGDSPYSAPVALDDSGEAQDDVAAADDADFDVSDDAPIATIAPAPARMRISTASYRHTIKGVERGKWTVELHEEADAPFEAVEAVLRGVRHRSTEPADPELVSRDALELLVAPVVVAPAA